jgi:hypothetical protein
MAENNTILQDMNANLKFPLTGKFSWLNNVHQRAHEKISLVE